MNNDDMFEPITGQASPLDDATSQANKAEIQEREVTLAWIKQQVDSAVRVANTPGDKYFIEQRGLRVDYSSSLVWAASYQYKAEAKLRQCLLFVVTNDKGEIVGVQSLEIDPLTGAKKSKTKPDKYSNGYTGEGFVFLGTSSELVATLVIGEGVETVLTRNMVSPCDSYACLGSLRFVQPKKHHKRVEILADTDKRDAARRLAKQYAEKGLSAYVVTVPDMVGVKADLNDVLQQSGLAAVRTAVEDAEAISIGTRNSLTNFKLEIGSDVEIAQRIIERLEEIYGTIIVCEGKIWRFDRTHWVAFEGDHLARFVHRADGATFADSEKKTRIVRLNKSRIASILDAVLKYRQEPNYFGAPPCGINCESGFIKIADDGTTELSPHARQWRQRHVVRGRWHGGGEPKNWQGSSLAKYLNNAFSSDKDAVAKINLLGETAGCTATGRGTKIPNPKAIVTYSDKGGTGKSAFLKLLRALPNKDAVASVPVGKFGDEKYTYRLIGKVLNATDELSHKAIKSDVFKRMITGDPVPARDVYCSAVDFVPVALHVFSTNVLPSFSGGMDGGTARRLLPIEFSHVVPEHERDEDLPERIINDEADLLLHFAVEGACRLMRQKGFTVPASSKILLEQWLLSGDPVRAWAAERLEVTTYENVIELSYLYHDFESWATNLGMKRDFLPNAIAFGKRLPSAVQGLESHRSDGSHYRNARLRPTI
ncbi:MAG: DUF5906 domain-containing protein [Alphaproteobacteria bacterium]